MFRSCCNGRDGVERGEEPGVLMELGEGVGPVEGDCGVGFWQIWNVSKRHSKPRTMRWSGINTFESITLDV